MGVRLASTLFLFTLIGCSILHPQTLTVSPKEVIIRQAVGGPMGAGRVLSITAAGEPVEWTAVATTDDGVPWIYLTAASGKTPASLFVGLVNYRAESQRAGHYTGTVKITARGATETIKVDWTVVGGAKEPTFTYLAGPAGCETPPGYPDPALCNVLDQSPLGKFAGANP